MVCTTSTLALGVNLPVYLVIIKGTVQWKGGGRGYEEIDNAMLQQMVVKILSRLRIDWESREAAVQREGCGCDFDEYRSSEQVREKE